MNATPIRGETHATLITAPGSGQGKFLVTAALARLHRNAGRRVRVFKHGPVYRDGVLVASYFHGHFPSAPDLVAALFHGRTPWP